MYLITAALPYANGPLHLGHVRSTYLPADIYKRYLKTIGEKTIYVCATDEHGTPIVLSAELEGKTPKELVDYYHQKDKEVFQRLAVDFDIFHRTHSKENEELTIYFFERLKENGYIYRKEVMQYYCQELKKFMPDRYVKGECPYCHAKDQYADQCEKCGRTFKPGDLINPYCVITNTKPILKSSNHYFLKLSDFSEFLKDYIDSNPRFQAEVVNYLRKWIKELKDWDIVRDMEWGIKVPNHDLVFYVWFDAPIGYISSTKALTPEWEIWWKSKKSKIVHFIGKDIIYHHYLFWPSMLYGVKDGFNLPYAIPTRGHLTLENQKFSKSRGWYITLEEFLDIFPADYLRYYMTYITPYSLSDANFSIEEFKERINNDLIANYGNLAYRVSKLLEKERINVVENSTTFQEEIKSLLSSYHNHMLGFDFKAGLDVAMAIVKEANRYINEKQPWKIEDKELKYNVLKKSYLYVLYATVMLYPFIPVSSSKLLENVYEPYFNSIYSQRDFKVKYLETPLFKKIEDSEINKLYVILKNRTHKN